MLLSFPSICIDTFLDLIWVQSQSYSQHNREHCYSFVVKLELVLLKNPDLIKTFSILKGETWKHQTKSLLIE